MLIYTSNKLLGSESQSLNSVILNLTAFLPLRLLLSGDHRDPAVILESHIQKNVTMLMEPSIVISVWHLREREIISEFQQGIWSSLMLQSPVGEVWMVPTKTSGEHGKS